MLDRPLLVLNRRQKSGLSVYLDLPEPCRDNLDFVLFRLGGLGIYEWQRLLQSPSFPTNLGDDRESTTARAASAWPRHHLKGQRQSI